MSALNGHWESFIGEHTKCLGHTGPWGVNVAVTLIINTAPWGPAQPKCGPVRNKRPKGGKEGLNGRPLQSVSLCTEPAASGPAAPATARWYATDVVPDGFGGCQGPESQPWAK